MAHYPWQLAVSLLCSLLLAQSGAPQDALPSPGPYARIAFLRPLDGHTTEFEAGYIRHLDWHRQAKDSWTWYGWSIWAGDRQRWFVYATFGHSAASLDSPVAPGDDERDNVLNVAPHVEYTGNGLYQFLPALSRGSGEPSPAPRTELTTIQLSPGAEKAFESALAAVRPGLEGETLWYRLLAGGESPRYVRLRPRPAISAILADEKHPGLPDEANRLVTKMIIEILTLRPNMSLGLPPAVSK